MKCCSETTTQKNVTGKRTLKGLVITAGGFIALHSMCALQGLSFLGSAGTLVHSVLHGSPNTYPGFNPSQTISLTRKATLPKDYLLFSKERTALASKILLMHDSLLAEKINILKSKRTFEITFIEAKDTKKIYVVISKDGNLEKENSLLVYEVGKNSDQLTNPQYYGHHEILFGLFGGSCGPQKAIYQS